MKTGLTCILAAVLLLFFCFSPILPPGHGQAASASDKFSFYAVYDRLVDTDTNNTRVYHTALSGDGKKLIFTGADATTGEAVVYTLNSDGSGLTGISLPNKLEGDIPQVVINRDGSRGFFFDRWSHLIYKVEGGAATLLIDTNNFKDIQGCTGIDTTASGEYVYFMENGDDLWRLNSNGGTPEKVIEDTEVPRQDSNGQQGRSISRFNLSADGNTILFRLDGHAEPTNYYGHTPKQELFIKGSSGYRQLTNDTQNVIKDYMDISGDGGTVVYSASAPDNKWFSMRTDGTAKTILANLGFNVGGVSLTFDGTRVFYKDDGANGGCLLNTDGSGRLDMFPGWNVTLIAIGVTWHTCISEEGNKVAFILQYASWPFKEALYTGHLNNPGTVADAPSIESISFNPPTMPRNNPDAKVILTSVISDPQGLADIERASTDGLIDGKLTASYKCPGYFYFAVHDDGNYPDQAAADGTYSTDGKPGETIDTIDQMTIRIGVIDKSRTVVVADVPLEIGGVMPPETTEPGAGIISGTITASTTGEPLAGVTVSIGSLQIVTGPEGSYVFNTVPAGPVTITASKEGYNNQTQSTDLSAYTSINLALEMDPLGSPSGVLLEHIYCAGINSGWARLGIHMYKGDSEPWNDPGVKACIDEWMRKVVDYHNRVYASSGPWRWTQYGALAGKSFVSQQAPDEWNTKYQGNLYKWMWLVCGKASYPGIPSITSSCTATGTSQGVANIINYLRALVAHSRASGFPFTNYEATISSMIDMLARGATMPEVAGVFDGWEPGFRNQLKDKTCVVFEGQAPVLLEHIYIMGINVGWARLGIHLGADRSDIISWLQATASAAKTCNFPFVGYEDPINKMISMLNSGATMPEIAGVFDAWEPGFRAQLRDKICRSSGGQTTTPATGSVLLVVTSESKLTNKFGAAGYARIKAEIDKLNGQILDVSSNDFNIIDKQIETIGSQTIKTILIVGGHDVVPFSVLPNSADTDILYTDDVYGDFDHDTNTVIDKPIARIPDGNDLDLVLTQFSTSGTSDTGNFSLANKERPWAVTIANMISSNILWSLPTLHNLIIATAVQARIDYFMLHGSRDDTTTWWGEGSDPLPQAFKVYLANSRGTIFSGCCYGTYVIDKNPTNSICLAFLKSGVRCFIGCTGIHYSGQTQKALTELGGRVHSLFFTAFLAGDTQLDAFFKAKRQYASEVKNAVQDKVMHEFVYFGRP